MSHLKTDHSKRHHFNHVPYTKETEHMFDMKIFRKNEKISISDKYVKRKDS